MEINIVSFNIRCCNDPEGNSIAERAVRLEQAVLPIYPDVIGLQEYSPKWETYIAEIFSDRYDMYYHYRSEEKPEACPILWRKDRFECLKKGHFWLSDTPEIPSFGWDEKYHLPRICTYVVLSEQSGKAPFTLINTHFGFGDEGQVKSARLMRSYRKKVAFGRTVIIGDFNMNPGSPGYLEMTNGFTDVNAVTARDFRSTFHGYHPEVPRNEHIDYCFIDRDVIPLQYERIETVFDGKYPSDHFGLSIKVNV